MSLEASKERKILLKDINSLLTCPLCGGYFVDATTFDCLHTFCRSCALNHFEKSKQQTCPTCDKKKTFFRPDYQLQALVYKMVPGLYSREFQRREEFYRCSVRASSTCSEDSLLDQDKWMPSQAHENYYSPEDMISLSLEFYQPILDRTELEDAKLSRMIVKKSAKSTKTKSRKNSVDIEAGGELSQNDKNSCHSKCERRYLQCPAAVSMTHLQKFLRMKYALSAEHQVDIIYEGEVLSNDYTLMDVAYTFNWSRLKPMRFFFRIFTPMKVQPIKIINAACSNGSKQLQIVPAVRPHEEQLALLPVDKNKEQFAAQLKLQLRHRTGLTADENCVYEYEEPDKEEIKRFAESRDREWARMRHEEDGSTSGMHSSGGHHVKKRKKNKHSKGDSSKKPKIHAEITSDVKQESMKLKVKLTPAHNGHKHKHRASLVPDLPKEKEVSKDKDKEREMIAPTVLAHEKLIDSSSPSPSLSSSSVDPLLLSQNVREKSVDVKFKEPVKKLEDIVFKKADAVPIKPNDKMDTSSVTKKELVVVESLKAPDTKHTQVHHTQQKKHQHHHDAKQPLQKQQQQYQQKQQELQKQKQEQQKQLQLLHKQKLQQQKLQSTLEAKRFEEQKTFLTTFQINSNKPEPTAKSSISTPKVEKKPINTYSNQTKQNSEKKIAAMQQKQNMWLDKTNKSKLSLSPKEKKVTFSNEKPRILNSQQYPASFTVSKVEQGVKRKAEEEAKHEVDKRPSLEITLINPSAKSSSSNNDPPKAKRPPPATIPLDRIKKSMNKPGMSMLSKMENNGYGALDLTKKMIESSSKLNGITTLNGIKNINGMKFSDKNQLTNLQLLSKVASQHSKQTNNNNNNNVVNKVRPQIPSLQTIRVPTPNNITKNSTNASNQGNNLNSSQGTQKNLANLPKLNEINKSTFKIGGGMRNVMPPRTNANAQNMTRNIPNPSLLVRQHNQSRLGLNGQSAQNAHNQNQYLPKSVSVSVDANTVTTTSSNNTQQPKILNILAKENTISKDSALNNVSQTTNNKDTKDSGTNVKINNISNKSTDDCSSLKNNKIHIQSNMQIVAASSVT